MSPGHLVKRFVPRCGCKQRGKDRRTLPARRDATGIFGNLEVTPEPTFTPIPEEAPATPLPGPEELMG